MDTRRVSACSICMHKLPLEQTLDVIAAAGFKKVDLLARMPHFSLDPNECDPAAVLEAAEQRGLRIANLGTYAGKGFASPDAGAQEHELALLHRAVDLAVFFGARSIRVVPGNDDPTCLDQIVPWFQRGAEYAERRGVYMGYENHGGRISGNPELCRQLASRVGSRYFGVLYEPCNLMRAGTDYRAALETLREHVVHVHFKDAAQAAQSSVLRHFGQGEIDFRWIERELAATGYDGDFALEYEIWEEPVETNLPGWYRAYEAL